VATSAPITDIHYDVTFARANAERRQVSSAMTFTVGGTEPVLLSLPEWTPGAYEIDNFARNVANFAAEEAGTALSWDKVDPDTWRVRPRGVGQVTVKFDYLADSLDNANTWARPDFLLFNGTNLFPYAEGRGYDFPASVTVSTEAGWKIVTGMTPAAPRRYSASNYHDLVDMPFFVGQFDVDSAQISGTWVRFASYPATSDKMSQIEVLPPTALEDASLSTWVHPRDGTEYIYYPKGSLAGLLIDIMIRDGSDNHSSLDDVMRTLYNSAYKAGRGFT